MEYLFFFFTFNYLDIFNNQGGNIVPVLSGIQVYTTTQNIL